MNVFLESPKSYISDDGGSPCPVDPNAMDVDCNSSLSTMVNSQPGCKYCNAFSDLSRVQTHLGLKVKKVPFTAIFIILRNLIFLHQGPNCISASIDQISKHSREDQHRLQKKNCNFCLVHSSNTIMLSF